MGDEDGALRRGGGFSAVDEDAREQNPSQPHPDTGISERSLADPDVCARPRSDDDHVLTFLLFHSGFKA